MMKRLVLLGTYMLVGLAFVGSSVHEIEAGTRDSPRTVIRNLDHLQFIVQRLSPTKSRPAIDSPITNAASATCPADAPLACEGTNICCPANQPLYCPYDSCIGESDICLGATDQEVVDWQYCCEGVQCY